MVEPPRRLAPQDEERISNVVNHMAGGSNAGLTRAARPVAADPRSAARSVAGTVRGIQTDPVVIGAGASGAGAGDVGIGAGATAANDSTAIGDSSTATGLQSFAANGTATGDTSIAINGHATATDATQVGSGGQASAASATSLGAAAEALGARSVALGAGALAPNPDDCMIGAPNHNVQIQGTFALTSGGATPVGPQPTPATLPDVIALLQAFGLSL